VELPELHDVWLRDRRRNLSHLAESGRGFEHKGKALPNGVQTWAMDRFPGAVHGYLSMAPSVAIHDLPTKVWLNLSNDVLRTTA